MSGKLRYFTVFFLIITLVFFIRNIYQVKGDEKEAVLKIFQAEDYFKDAYLSILKVERAGGDVSELVRLFNNALEYSSYAMRAFRSGEFEKAILYAEKSVETSNLVLEADFNLLFFTENINKDRFRNQLLLSFGFIYIIILFGFLGWRQFKGYYIRKILRLRPEVGEYES